MSKVKENTVDEIKSIKILLVVLVIMSVFNTIGLIYLINLNNNGTEGIANQGYQAAADPDLTDDYHTQSIIFNTDIEEIIGHDLAHGVNDALLDYAAKTYGDTNNMYIITSSQEGDIIKVYIGKDNDTFIAQINPIEGTVEILTESKEETENVSEIESVPVTENNLPLNSEIKKMFNGE